MCSYSKYVNNNRSTYICYILIDYLHILAYFCDDDGNITYFCPPIWLEDRSAVALRPGVVNDHLCTYEENSEKMGQVNSVVCLSHSA